MIDAASITSLSCSTDPRIADRFSPCQHTGQTNWPYGEPAARNRAQPSTEDPRETPSLHRAGQADRRSNSLISLRGREPKEVPQTTLAAQHCRVYGKVPVFWHESRGACLGGSARDSEIANSLLQGGVTVSSEVPRLSPHFDCCCRSTIPTPSVLLAVARQSAIQPGSRENRGRAEVLRRAKT
jgi:hypothetical protein